MLNLSCLHNIIHVSVNCLIVNFNFTSVLWGDTVRNVTVHIEDIVSDKLNHYRFSKLNHP